MAGMQGTRRAAGSLWVGEQVWSAGERMGIAGIGCVGHTEQEARSPDVATAACRMQGP